MHAIDEVDIRMPCRSEQHRIARCTAGGGVRGRVANADIGFHLHDAADQQPVACAANQQLAQNPAPDSIRLPFKKGAAKQHARIWFSNCC